MRLAAGSTADETEAQGSAKEGEDWSVGSTGGSGARPASGPRDLWGKREKGLLQVGPLGPLC